MKEFEIVYSPEDHEMLLFNNLELSKLTDPITIEREEFFEENEHVFDKKKSEVVEYENEEYLLLKEKEQDPFLIIDAESRAMCGKFQDVSDGASMYFALINVGNYLKIVPIDKWYRFVQKNQFTEGDIEGLEKNLNNVEVEAESSGSVHEIDYENVFDDDEGDANEIFIERSKMLSSSGKKLQGLVECYEESTAKEKKKKEVVDDTANEEEVVKKIKCEGSEKKKMTKEDIKKAFKGKVISVKDLLKNLREKFIMTDVEKNMIREFLKDNCNFETDPATGENILKLKK